MPVGAISSAVTRPTVSSSSGFQLAAMASWVGKIVRVLPERVAVDAVLADEQRDAEAVLRGEVHRPADLRAEDVEERAGLARVDEREVLAPGVQHQQLSDLLLERHAVEQVGDALVDGAARGCGRQEWASGNRRRRRQREEEGRERRSRGRAPRAGEHGRCWAWRPESSAAPRGGQARRRRRRRPGRRAPWTRDASHTTVPRPPAIVSNRVTNEPRTPPLPERKENRERRKGPHAPRPEPRHLPLGPVQTEVRVRWPGGGRGAPGRGPGRPARLPVRGARQGGVRHPQVSPRGPWLHLAVRSTLRQGGIAGPDPLLQLVRLRRVVGRQLVALLQPLECVQAQLVPAPRRTPVIRPPFRRGLVTGNRPPDSRRCGPAGCAPPRCRGSP